MKLAGVLIAALIALASAAAAQAPAARFDDGVAAYARGDYQAAWFAFWTLAQQGDPIAQFNLSRLYIAGEGVERDAVAARKWVDAAAHQGYPPAMFALGQYYQMGPDQTGKDDAADPRAAKRWYEAAAFAGYGLAQFNLALMYELGLGGEKDLGLARQWYARAAEQQVPRAHEALLRLANTAAP